MSYKDYHIILASNSPRRKELLRGLDIAFDVRVQPNIAETYPNTIAPSDVAAYISSEKADAYKDTITDNELVITADTVVSWTTKYWESLTTMLKQSKCYTK